MKKLPFNLTVVLIATLLLSSCKKNDTSPSDSVYSSTDHNSVTQHLNASMDDAANAAGGVGSMSGKTDGAWKLLEGFSTIDSISTKGQLTLVYDGSVVIDGKFTRTGSVTITLEDYPNKRWKDQGAVLDVTFNSVKFKNVSNGEVTQYDGLHNITNLTGGLAWKKVLQLETGVVKHQHTATGLMITFPDGSKRTWNVNRIRTYSNNGGVSLSITADPNSSQGGYNNVDAWGTNRKGQNFYNQIITPLLFNTTCSNYIYAISGEVSHHVNNSSLNVLFGVNSNGTQSIGNCPYGFKVTYTASN